MAESNKTTRGTNFVRNFGRTAPALKQLLGWTERDITSQPLIDALRKFFTSQTGADDQLKFWHCAVKQFPKWNEKLIRNTSSRSDAYMSWAERHPEDAREDEKPLGTTDPYLHSNPLVKDDWAQPFHIIHTRDITAKDAARAALVAIDHDELLRGLFKWSPFGDKELNDMFPWDGKELLGLSESPHDEVRKARRKWYVPKNTKWEKNYQHHQKNNQRHYPMTIVSDSVVRTINWWLQEISKPAKLVFDVYRINDITDRIRSNRWPIPQALKSYRIDWPIVRNIEETALVTNQSQTKVLTDLVSKYAGKYVAEHVNETYEDAQEANKNPDEEAMARGEGGFDLEVIEDQLSQYYDKYRAVVAPFGHDMPANFRDVTDTATLSKDAVENWMNAVTTNSKRQSDLFNFIAGTKKAQPHLFPETAEGDEVSLTGETILVNRVCPAPKTAIEDAQLVAGAMASPIPFPDSPAALYDHFQGEVGVDGTPLDSDFSCVRFVGYECWVKGETYEAIVKQANAFCEKHFPPSLVAMGGFSVTLKMLKWANQNQPIPKNGKIICPDPRTAPAKLR